MGPVTCYTLGRKDLICKMLFFVQICDKPLGCGHMCPEPCHDNVKVKNEVIMTAIRFWIMITLVKASASGSVDSGLIPSQVCLLSCKLGLIPENNSVSFPVPLGRHLAEFPRCRVVDRWSATPKRSR